MSMDAEPEPRSESTAADQDDATNQGVSTSEPAEGSDDAPAGSDGSPDA